MELKKAAFVLALEDGSLVIHSDLTYSHVASGSSKVAVHWPGGFLLFREPRWALG